jgi:hypothetical protein
MPTTELGITYPDSGSHNRLWEHLQTLATDVDDRIGKIVASWVTTPSLTTVTTETDVVSNSWTPPVVGCYRIDATVPYDSGGVTDGKARIRVDGTELDYDIRAAPTGTFVGKLRVSTTIDIYSLTPVIVKSTIDKGSGAGALNCRIVQARIEIFLCGKVDIRA